MKKATHTRFMEICREAGWKCTSQRLAVYDFLQDNLSHPDVDTVWHAVRSHLPAITRESVYRILNEFADRGIIARLDHIDNARYDSRTGPHGHFICEKCGTIVDFDLPGNTVLPPKLPGRIGHMELRVIGRCEKCENSAETTEFK